MQTDHSAHRFVRLERVENSKFLVTNDRGGQMRIGTGEGTEFTPVDLLLAGIGGCTGIDVDILTSRRAEPEAFAIDVDAEKVRDEDGSHLADIVVTFRVRFPDGEQGDKARALLPDAVRKSHDRLCTVSRTVELATPVTARIEGPGGPGEPAGDADGARRGPQAQAGKGLSPDSPAGGPTAIAIELPRHA